MISYVFANCCLEFAGRCPTFAMRDRDREGVGVGSGVGVPTLRKRRGLTLSRVRISQIRCFERYGKATSKATPTPQEVL